jgi:hypothetical protein
VLHKLIMLPNKRKHLSRGINFVLKQIGNLPFKEDCFGWIQADGAVPQTQSNDWIDIYALLQGWRDIAIVSLIYLPPNLIKHLVHENFGFRMAPQDSPRDVILFRQTPKVFTQMKLLVHAMENKTCFGSIQKGETGYQIVLGLLLGYTDENIKGYIRRITRRRKLEVSEEMIEQSLISSKNTIRVLLQLF